MVDQGNDRAAGEWIKYKLAWKSEAANQKSLGSYRLPRRMTESSVRSFQQHRRLRQVAISLALAPS